MESQKLDCCHRLYHCEEPATRYAQRFHEHTDWSGGTVKVPGFKDGYCEKHAPVGAKLLVAVFDPPA